MVGTLTCSTCPITGAHSFIDSSGNKLDIVCYNRYCAKSTNGNAFTDFLTVGASSATRWSWVDAGGIAYGGNNAYDPIIKYDGTTVSRPTGMPKGSILELSQDRLIVADIQSNPNRVHRSSAGAFEQFTTGSNAEDSFFDDVGAPGDKVRGLKCFNGSCFIFKTGSITACEESDQYSTRCSVISPNIGTTDPASIVTAGSSLYFRAQDKNYWELDRGGLRQISRKIPNLVKSQSGGLGGGETSNLQTTQADWQNGVQSPTGTFDTASLPGSIFPSSFTLVDTSSQDWANGSFANLTTATLNGTLSLSSFTARDNFEDGDFSTGITTWTQTVPAPPSTGWDIVTRNGVNYLGSNVGGGTDCNIITTANPISSGSWKWIHRFPPAGSAGTDQRSWEVYVQKVDADNYYSVRRIVRTSCGSGCEGADIQIVKKVGGVETTLASNRMSDQTNSTEYTYELVRQRGGHMNLTVDGVFQSSTTDTAVSSGKYLEVYALQGSVYNEFRGFIWFNYAQLGTITSRVFDSNFSTPTWGVTLATISYIPSESNIAIYTQSYVNGTSNWSTVASTSDTLRNNAAQRKYFRYVLDFSTLVSTKTPVLSEIGFNYASTGTFRIQCIQPNSAISAWGSLTCAEELSGNGSLVYYATSAATCAGLPTTPPTDSTKWTTVTNNATLSIATNTAVYIGFRSLLTSATDHAQVDACSLNWNEGTPVQPAWAVYDSIKNAVYWTTTINNGAYSNRLLKYDRNLEAWYPFTIAAQAPRMINNKLYFGGASSGTWAQYGLVDSDNGTAINGYWKSKDLGSDRPFHEKTFNTVSVLTRNNQAGTLTGTYTFSNASSISYSVSLSTGPGITYARSTERIRRVSPVNFLNVQFGNNTTTPFEILGVGVDWTVSPWRVGGP